VIRIAVTTSLFVIYVVASSVGLLIVKGSIGNARLMPLQAALASSATWYLLLGCGFYGLSFTLWIVILSRMPLSVAYPISIGLTMAGTTLGAVTLLGEEMSWLKFAGMAVIFAGTTAVALSNS
jgi:multidrug transporter EmrE-like cation transporter